MQPDLYLDLLKRVLTDTIFNNEPDLENETPGRFLLGFVDHYIKGRAISMLPIARFDNLQNCIRDVVQNGIPGDLIETGVWRGGATIFMRAALEAYADKNRKVWVADSFEGLPEPDAEKFPLEAKAFHGVVQTKVMNHLAVGEEDVRENFRKFGLLDDRVKFLKGWFKDTLPTAPIERLAVLRLDGDHYESTMDALTSLYDRLSPGGYVIVDDYGEKNWTYCKKAVDEFRAARSITAPLQQVDSVCFFWKRDQ